MKNGEKSRKVIMCKIREEFLKRKGEITKGKDYFQKG